jgi:hypothetical protein
MPTIQVRTSLPTSIVNVLREKGSTIREECEIKIIELLEKVSIQAYDNFLISSDEEMDPLLMPVFGAPLSQYVSVNVQAEVHQLLATFQSLLADALTCNTLPHLARFGQVPPVGGYQYHHTPIAIQRVMQEIENPNPGFVVPGLNNVPSGNVICDMSITYSNCIVVRRIRRH